MNSVEDITVPVINSFVIVYKQTCGSKLINIYYLKKMGLMNKFWNKNRG